MTRFEEDHDPADHADTVARDHDVPASSPEEDLTETSKYFVESIEQARQRADKLKVETSRRSSLALKELDELSNNSAHVTAFRASGEFRRLKERVCNAEKNVVIERDRYARLLSRYTALSERQTDDVKRIHRLQRAMSEYQQINEMLARQLEQQGSTLERLVMSMRRARDEMASNSRSDHEAADDDRGAAPDDYAAWSRRQLESAVHEASQVLEDFDVFGEPGDIAGQTFPMGRRRLY